jgi:hypothetical protein
LPLYYENDTLFNSKIIGIIDLAVFIRMDLYRRNGDIDVLLKRYKDAVSFSSIVDSAKPICNMMLYIFAF